MHIQKSVKQKLMETQATGVSQMHIDYTACPYPVQVASLERVLLSSMERLTFLGRTSTTRYGQTAACLCPYTQSCKDLSTCASI